MNNPRVDHVVDLICKRGCRYVNQVIDEGDEACNCRELHQLKPSEQHKVIEELKVVMSVYNQTGSCEA